MNSVGKVVMESVIETKASMILQFIDGLRGDLQVTFEEGTSAAWLYDLLRPNVAKLVVCDPRKNKSMREGNQNDKIDARRLAELLRLDLTPGVPRPTTRVKAIYRSWAIPCIGKQAMPDAIARSGPGRSPSRECAGAQNLWWTQHKISFDLAELGSGLVDGHVL
jgi:hypothetical protein